MRLSLCPRDQEVCEHMFVTSHGHAYARFRRALKGRNALLAIAAAHDLRTVSLADALELLLLLAREGGRRYGRAAIRWHSRYCREVEDVSGAEATAMLGLLLMLDGPRGKPAAEALACLVRQQLSPVSSDVLTNWQR
jgi:hypothetical protein